MLDTQGAVVPDAKVTVTSLDTGEVREVISGDSGGCTLPEQWAGRLRLVAERVGRSGIDEPSAIAGGTDLCSFGGDG